MNEMKAATKQTCDFCNEPDDKLSTQSLGGELVSVCRYCMRSPALAGALGASAMHEMEEDAAANLGGDDDE